MTSPSPREVNAFHARSDKDTSSIAQHHSLGPDHNQASPGDHLHDGRTSKFLATHTLTGALAPASVSELDAIVDQLITILKNFTDISDIRS